MAAEAPSVGGGDSSSSRAAAPPEPPAPRKKPHSLATALSGATSGLFTSACLQPLDVTRTKMQGDSAKGINRGTMATVSEVMRTSGLRGFWQGTGPSVIRVGLGVGINMVLLENIKEMLTRKAADGGSGSSQLSAIGAAFAGGSSRAVAALLLCPVTVVKTRMEYSSKDAVRYNSTFHALSTITATEGVRGLFRGLVPTILTNAPFSALYYMFYTRLKSRLAGDGRPQALVNFSSGSVAAVGATLLTQPFDVVRTRIQLGSGSTGGAFLGSFNMLRSIIATQGTAGLLIGTFPRLLKRASQTALVWTLYEELLPRLTSAMEWSAVLPSPSGNS